LPSRSASWTNRVPMLSGMRGSGVPRTRGDEPGAPALCRQTRTRSPPARG
jgi:hypothetical protein